MNGGIYVFAASSAFHGEGCHETDRLDFGTCGFGTSLAGEFGGIEVRGVVFGEDFAFRHDGLAAVFGCCEDFGAGVVLANL